MVNAITIIPIVLTLGALLLAFLRRTSSGALESPRARSLDTGGAKDRSGTIVLGVFGVIVVIYAVFAAFAYGDKIREYVDDFWLAGGLLLTMIAGMIVRVVSANYQARRVLFKVNWQELVFPMVFSPIVFFPVWSITTEGQSGLFVFHAAFLNGYFWESIVASTRSPSEDPA